MVSGRRKAFVHIDCDELWAIDACYGLPDGGEASASYVAERGLPRIAELLDEVRGRGTWFVVGRDLENAANRKVLAEIAAAGHRIGNHSWSHPLDFRTRTREAIADEVQRGHEAIASHLGVEAVGFRAPGYGVSPALGAVLRAKGYRYDSSLMPSAFGPVLRALDRRLWRGSADSWKRKTQFPRAADALRTLSPHLWRIGGGTLAEIPVAAAPILRLPMQAAVCQQAGWAYFRTLAALQEWCGTAPWVFLLHGADATDFSGAGHPFYRESAFFRMSGARKVDLLRRFLRHVTERFDVVTTEEWLDSAEGRARLGGA